MKSKRLVKVCSFLEENDYFGDIGCDHGYLSLLAIKKGITNLQLIDNKQGPLNRAYQNLKGIKKGVNITFTLGDGLSLLLPDIDVIAICGMGGHLIIEIIDKALARAKSLKRLVLQANSDLYHLRVFLRDKGFIFQNEAIIEENNQIYEIIICSYSPNRQKIDLKDCYFGPFLRKAKDPLFQKKHQKRIDQIHNILKKKLSNERKEALQIELNWLKDEILEK